MEYDYYGCGSTARLIAQMEACRGELRQQRIAQERMEARRARDAFSELAATPEDLTLLLEQAKRAAAQALEAAGYHQHKRQWRKKRANKDKNQGENSRS